MRVLITNHFPLEGSGSGIYTQNVALELAKTGHEVMAIAPDHKKVDGYPFEVRSIVFSNGENSEFDLPFNFPCFTTHPISNNTYYDLTDDEIRTYVDTYQRYIDDAVRDFLPDIIHAQHLWVGTYCGSNTPVPYVATVHGTDLMGYEKDERYRAMANQAFEQADRLIAISEQIEEKTEELFGASEKVTTILNGFSTDIFRVMDDATKAGIFKEFGLPETRYLISFVGKLTDFKGVDVLIRAAETLEKRLESVTVLITGMGGLRDQLGALADELGLSCVHFIGHQTQQTVARINNAADLAVFPSRVEPFGLVALEALACGTPVVTTNEGGFPDFVNEKVGAMVDVDAPDQLGEEIIAELESGAKENKGPYAARYAAEGFSWKKKVGQFLEIYEQALEAKNA